MAALSQTPSHVRNRQSFGITKRSYACVLRSKTTRVHSLREGAASTSNTPRILEDESYWSSHSCHVCFTCDTSHNFNTRPCIFRGAAQRAYRKLRKRHPANPPNPRANLRHPAPGTQPLTEVCDAALSDACVVHAGIWSTGRWIVKSRADRHVGGDRRWRLRPEELWEVVEWGVGWMTTAIAVSCRVPRARRLPILT